jgi:hypothetical protein
MKRLTTALSAVLYDCWDPVNARADGAPRDEYEGYVEGIVREMGSGASDDVIAEYLASLEDKWMGIDPSPLAHRLAVVAAMRQVMREVADEDLS